MGIKCDLKVVLLGSAHVGKTTLIRRLIENKCVVPNNYVNTIGAVFATKNITLSNGKTLCLGIWDTAGEERFESVSRVFYRGSNAAIVCYEVTYPKSWERAKRWITEIRHHEENCRIYVCGTKVDLLEEPKNERAVPKHIVQYYTEGINIPYFETSSKTGENVDKLFQTIAEDFADEQSLLVIISTVDLVNQQPKKIACC